MPDPAARLWSAVGMSMALPMDHVGVAAGAVLLLKIGLGRCCREVPADRAQDAAPPTP